MACEPWRQLRDLSAIHRRASMAAGLQDWQEDMVLSAQKAKEALALLK